MTFFRFLAAIRHRLCSIRSKGGYGVHSPFAFNFITEILNPSENNYYYCFHYIEKVRYYLSIENRNIELENGNLISIKKASEKFGTTSTKNSQRLFRIALRQKSNRIIELESGLGIASAYFAATSQKSQVTTINKNISLQKLAKENHEKLGLRNINYISGDIKRCLVNELTHINKVDLIYFENIKQGSTTLEYFNIALPFVTDKSIFIFQNIHLSKEMNTAWKSIYKHQQITASFELLNMGIVFFDKTLNKEHYYA